MNTATVMTISIAVTVLLTVIGAVWKLGRWSGTIDSDHKSFREIVGKLESKLDEISKAVYQLLGASKDSVAATASPLKLNDFGQKISSAFGAKEWANARAGALHGQMAGKQPYDVQQFCFDYVTEDILSEDELKRAKDIAYDNGTIISNVLRVLAFELRDCLLTREEVDTL